MLKEGTKRKTRNYNTISLFGESLKFNIENSFPLLTTKKMFWKGIAEELLWFIGANTDSKILEDTPSVRGMITQVEYLLAVEEVK